MFAFVWDPDVEPTATPSVQAVDPVRGAQPEQQESSLPPFAELNQERARELAQEKLGVFVERQILLEETMDVGTWGADGLATAKALAVQGDAEFVAERFESSIAKYEEAAHALGELIEVGDRKYREHYDAGMSAIDNLVPETAVAELTSALTIKPESDEAKGALARAERLPEVITMLRTAKNHELGERFNDAVAVYDAIKQIDPDIPNLAELRSGAVGGAQSNNVNAHLTRGFAALERRDFEAARSSFNRALALEPGNDIAEGGLQQVQKEYDLDVIARTRADAEAALDDEQWTVAKNAYQRILDLDANIQFALAGRRIATAHERAQRLLTRIKTEPKKLSSEKLYLDAQSIVREAKDLSRKGPELDQLVADVDALLKLYRDPVEVTLLSDNATNVIVSNVGRLGTFERKTLSLRPGQYTIRGSRDGCRDIYMSVDVIPGIDPIDLSCQDL